MSDLVVKQDNTEKVVNGMKTAILRALEAIGIEAERDAARITPVDTGRLKNSITHAVEGGEKYVAVGTNVEYGKYVHMGTRGRPGKPFLTDAVTQNAGKYRRIAQAALKGE